MEDKSSIYESKVSTSITDDKDRSIVKLQKLELIANTAATGDMLSRVVFAVVNKAADDTMTVTWTITLSAT
jgi:hypothetical protein